MPLEYQCLRCCQCQTFQAKQVTKGKKWACSKCGQKQTLQRVFAISTSAKDIRLHVQRLNMPNGDQEESCLNTMLERFDEEGYDGEEEQAYWGSEGQYALPAAQSLPTRSDWNSFTYEDAAAEDDTAGLDEDEPGFVTSVKDSISKGKGRKGRANPSKDDHNPAGRTQGNPRPTKRQNLKQSHDSLPPAVDPGPRSSYGGHRASTHSTPHTPAPTPLTTSSIANWGPAPALGQSGHQFNSQAQPTHFTAYHRQQQQQQAACHSSHLLKPPGPWQQQSAWTQPAQPQAGPYLSSREQTSCQRAIQQAGASAGAAWSRPGPASLTPSNSVHAPAPGHTTAYPHFGTSRPTGHTAIAPGANSSSWWGYVDADAGCEAGCEEDEQEEHGWVTAL